MRFEGEPQGKRLRFFHMYVSLIRVHNSGLHARIL